MSKIHLISGYRNNSQIPLVACGVEEEVYYTSELSKVNCRKCKRISRRENFSQSDSVIKLVGTKVIKRTDVVAEVLEPMFHHIEAKHEVGEFGELDSW